MDDNPSIVALGTAEKREPKQSRIHLVPFDEIALSGSTDWLVKGILPAGGLTVVWGPPKCGKTFWVTDASLHVALGWEYRSRRVKQGPVVYVAAEGAHGFRTRVRAFQMERLVEADRRSVPFYLVPATINLVEEAADLIKACRLALQDRQPALVVLDTLNRTMRGSESSDQDMSAYIKAADSLREALQCAVLIIHHCGIETSRPRGHTSLTGAADAQIAVKRDTDDIIVATVECMKDGEEGATIASKLRVVEVGRDEDNDPITSCVVEPSDEPARSAGARLNKRQKQGLEVLHDMIINAGEPSPGGPDLPDDVEVVHVDYWKDYLLEFEILNSSAKNPRQDFKRLKDGLIKRGLIRESNGLVWTVKGVE